MVEDTTAEDMVFLVRGRAVVMRRGVEVRSQLLYIHLYLCQEVLCRSCRLFLTFSRSTCGSIARLGG